MTAVCTRADACQWNAALHIQIQAGRGCGDYYGKSDKFRLDSTDLFKLRKRGIMMKNYVKPTVVPADGFCEGIYMASGSNDCLTITADIEYTPDMQFSGGRYSIRLTANHTGDHFSYKQRATITFNKSVEFFEQQGGGVCVGSASGTVLVIEWDLSAYGIGPGEQHGYGYLKVSADLGLEILSVSAEDLSNGSVRSV